LLLYCLLVFIFVILELKLTVTEFSAVYIIYFKYRWFFYRRSIMQLC